MRLTNAFSLNMVADFPVNVQVEELSVEQARVLAADCESVVGHADTAAVFSDVLGFDVPANRATVALVKGDQLVIGQYRGPRLAEGARQLPEGATIQWLKLTVA